VSAAPGDHPPFRDAEAWLAARGVVREPIRAEPVPATGPPGEPEPAAPPPVSAREAERLAGQASADAQLRSADAAALPDPDSPRLEDDVAAAVAFIRRSAGTAPQSEGRLRDKLSDRGFAPAAIEPALDRARSERLVDDDALAAALVQERRAKGHAGARIRRDLADRGFEPATIDRALGSAADEDPEAAAFAIARVQAERHSAAPAEAAFRRVVGYLVRRGHPEALARKVAREAVFAVRDRERSARR
jgi:regulatory protein